MNDYNRKKNIVLQVISKICQIDSKPLELLNDNVNLIDKGLIDSIAILRILAEIESINEEDIIFERFDANSVGTLSFFVELVK